MKKHNLVLVSLVLWAEPIIAGTLNGYITLFDYEFALAGFITMAIYIFRGWWEFLRIGPWRRK
jgi:hypothetical protein